MSDELRALLARPHVAALLAAFREAGSAARVVGGAVRDAAVGRPPGDIDFATPMRPEAVARLIRSRGWKAIPTGIDHGTVTAVLDHRAYEITTLRRDVSTDGRRAVVAFTDDYREDAFRRDFTLNALSLDDEGRLHDYATGLADARAGVIRFMGDPDTRIREDYLRILRFFRFHASHGRGAPEASGVAACARLKEGMAVLSRERVRQEVLKLLLAFGAADAVDAMTAIELWPHVLPNTAIDGQAFRRWTRLEAAFAAGRLPKAGMAMSALATLAPAAAPDVLAASLRLSRDEAATLGLIRRTAELGARAIVQPALRREFVYRAGPDAAAAALRAAAAVSGADPADVAAALPDFDALAARPPRLPFAGADVAALGVAPGPRMGRALGEAEARWIAAGLPEDEHEVRRILAEAVAATS